MSRVRSAKKQALSARANYDAFIVEHSRPTRVQFWGLILLGGNLVLLGVALFAAVARKLAPPIDVGDALVLLLTLGVCSCIAYFGFQHLARAFEGGDGKPRRRR